MKKGYRGILAAALLALGTGQAGAEPAAPLKGTVTISGAWALYPLAVKWAEEFAKVAPGVKVDISAGGAGKGMADCLGGVVDIGMVSREITPTEAERGAWWVAVAKDAVVPVMNAANPAAAAVKTRGITPAEFQAIWLEEKIKDWKELGGPAGSPPLSVYTRSDACGAAETWAAFLGKKQEDLLGVGVYGDPGLAQAVHQDIRGIGFNNVNYVYEASTRKQVAGLMVVPIDLNGDGKISPEEDFYSTRDELTAAIGDGRYPSPPARDLYFVCRGRPQAAPVAAFISWALGPGRAYIQEAGYIDLSPEKIAGALSRLAGDAPAPPEGGRK